MPPQRKRRRPARLPDQAVALGCILMLAAAPAQAAAIRTQSGLLTGVTAAGVETFKGIPYALPPVGKLRWRAPQPPLSWTGIRAADHYGAPCIQRPGAGDLGSSLPASEDCLTLSVTRPAGTARKLPVLVWIHGGGLMVGASSQALFKGDAFARQGLILVSMNYRLGPLGFFAHPLLAAANADHGPLGNYGLMDQIAALRWIRRNIAAFGGDPDHVTIFGESAGAVSVETLMISPPARGLFQAAIVDSGFGWFAYPRATQRSPDGADPAEARGAALIARTGQPGATLAELRAIPPQALIGAFRQDAQTGLMQDATTLPEDLATAFRAGHEAHVPLLIGANGFEYEKVTEAAATVVLNQRSTAAQRAALLPHSTGPRPIAYLISDLVFLWQTRTIAQLHQSHGNKTYLYRFEAVPHAMQAQWSGAPHGSELAYVFDTLAAAEWKADAQDQALATRMNADWAGFARTGTASWRSGELMRIGAQQSQPGPDPEKPQLDAITAVSP